MYFIRALSLGPLRYIGRISYGLYMIHPFVFGVVGMHLLGLKGIFAGVGISVLFAALSWRFFESPILQLGRRSAKANDGAVPAAAAVAAQS